VYIISGMVHNINQIFFLPIAKKSIFFGFDDKKYSYIIMDIENENNKMHYINDAEFIEEESCLFKYETSNE